MDRNADRQLTIVSSSIPPEGAPKKIRKLASESGIPASLRGKVWAWFLGPLMPRREVGRFEELVNRGGGLDERMEMDINRYVPSHSLKRLQGRSRRGNEDEDQKKNADDQCIFRPLSIRPLSNHLNRSLRPPFPPLSLFLNTPNNPTHNSNNSRPTLNSLRSRRCLLFTIGDS